MVVIPQDNFAGSLIGFDGAQVLVRFTSPEIGDLIGQVFGRMKAEAATNVVCEMSIEKRDDGYVLKTPAPIDFPGQTAHLLVPVLKHRIVNAFVETRPDLLWLHAGAVSRADIAMLLLGPSGQGKSTLSTGLCERGWSFLSDDVAPVLSTGKVMPFPMVPSRRISSGIIVDPSKLGEIRRETVDLRGASIASGARSVRLAVSLHYTGKAVFRLKRLTAGEAALELLRNSSSFGRQPRASVQLSAGLVARVLAFRLEYGSTADALSVLDSLDSDPERLL